MFYNFGEFFQLISPACFINHMKISIEKYTVL